MSLSKLLRCNYFLRINKVVNRLIVTLVLNNLGICWSLQYVLLGRSDMETESVRRTYFLLFHKCLHEFEVHQNLIKQPLLLVNLNFE